MANDVYEKHLMDLLPHLTNASGHMTESGQYYDATYRLKTVGLSTPPEMRCLTAAIGWPRMYLDSLEERLDVEGFRLAGKSDSIEEMHDWWQANGLDEESGLAHLDALIYGRSYVTVAAPGPGDEPGVPIIRVESPLNMYAETDPRTRRVTRAVRLYQRPGEVMYQWATLYLPDVTVPLKHEGGSWQLDGKIVRHKLGVVPVVPIYNRERLADRDGRSEITPELRSFTDAAARTMMNMQAAAELMAVPQRILFGVNAEDLIDPETGVSTLDTYLARIIALENEAGKAFQFTAAELRNFTEVLDQLAKHVASYTGLPPQYLSFQSDNPASAEAIKSSESRLVKKCERKQRMYGGSWEQVMRLADQVIKGSVDVELNRLETMWRDPATPTFASKADAVTKLYANGQGIIPKERARIDLGYTNDERAEMKEWDEDEQDDAVKALASVVGMPARGGQDPEQQTGPPVREAAA
jgi:hypothetical protein